MSAPSSVKSNRPSDFRGLEGGYFFLVLLLLFEETE